ncbi:hypothetical protein MTO96_046401 [Rhipicephalus appendiculatus]
MKGNHTMILLLVFVACTSLVHVNGQHDMEPHTLTTSSSSSRWPSWSWPSWSRCWKRHEEYKTCVSGSCSEWRCSYLYKGWPDACTLDCRSGCFCKKGYFRNRRGNCVLGYRCFRDILPYVRTFDE